MQLRWCKPGKRKEYCEMAEKNDNGHETPEPGNPLSSRAYVARRARRGEQCPVCGCGDIVGKGVDVLAETARQEISCSGCNATWTDTYQLIGYEDLNTNQD